MTQAVNKGPHDLSQKEAPGVTFAHSVACRRSRTRPAEFAMKPSTCCALCKLAGAYAPLVARIKESVKKKGCIFLVFSPKDDQFRRPPPFLSALKATKKKQKKKISKGKRKRFVCFVYFVVYDVTCTIQQRT